MHIVSGYHGPRPDQYQAALTANDFVTPHQENSPLHLFRSAQTVYLSIVERGEHAKTFDLQELNRVLDAMETRGYLTPVDKAGFHKAYTQMAEYTRTFVQAEILQALPKPPHWAPAFPDMKRVEKHLTKIMEYAILMMDNASGQDQATTLPFLAH